MRVPYVRGGPNCSPYALTLWLYQDELSDLEEEDERPAKKKAGKSQKPQAEKKSTPGKTVFNRYVCRARVCFP